MTEEIMAKFDEKEILELWDNTATDWDIQVGEEGDSNRILNSDPVLWSFAGNVAGLSVLDAGCGTGYLALKPLIITRPVSILWRQQTPPGAIAP
ncbi:hypothetical protein [Nostoc sp.]|uniref:hypothetical protein n=1 Tax=Nostoc sp. TaxID=1180 RepID=UPI002FFAE50F